MTKRRQTNNDPVITNQHIDPRRNLITFNYSESFNRIIELNTENYKGWSRKIFYLLSINKLTKYVLKQNIKKLRKKNIQGNLDDYVLDPFDDSFVYEKGTTTEDIENDNTSKWIVINSLAEKTSKLVEGNEKTAFHI